MFLNMHFFDVVISTISVVSLLYIISFIISLTIIFLERKDPSASLAWIMILFMIPGIGILLYIFFSQNIARKKIFYLTRHEDMVFTNELRSQMRKVKEETFPFLAPEAAKWSDTILMHQSYSRSFFTQDNDVHIFTNGDRKFASLFKDIEGAKESIHIMYFIIKNDETGQALIQLLTQKAREGVAVRLLVDSMGSRQISPWHLKEFKEAGGKYAYFFPPVLKFLNLKVNYRNHRKMVVIDNKIGYLGGFNVGNAYINKGRFGIWRDTHLRLIGSCVQDISARFILDWRFASKEDIPLSAAYFGPVEHQGETGIQIVASGPDSSRAEIHQGYLKLISNAKKRIYIQTPYFIPDNSIVEALRTAVHSGVDVRLMIPNRPDHVFVYWATYYYVGVLLEAGATAYIYDNGFLHAKTICVDGEAASVGSANFDIRSFKLSFEANAFIYDKTVVKQLEDYFEADMVQSQELTLKKYRHRSTKIKCKESICRLISEVL